MSQLQNDPLTLYFISVAAVTDPDSPDFIPERDRIAVFDNDGTLWTEQPIYAQLVFAPDRAAELGHPTSLGRAARGRDENPGQAVGEHIAAPRPFRPVTLRIHVTAASLDIFDHVFD